MGIRKLVITITMASVLLVASGPLLAGSHEIEQRLQRIEKLLDSQSLTDMYLQLQEVRQELQRMQGLLEEQTYAIDGLKKRQRELYLDVDRRLRQVESGAARSTQPAVQPTPSTVPMITGRPAMPGPAPGSVSGISASPASIASQSARSVTTTSSSARASTSTTVSADEEAAYRRAFNLLKEGRYQEAVAKFRVFLQNYPTSSYADNSQYWLGEAHYVTRAFEMAIVEFQKVVNLYPTSPKIADAMLKIGYCYYELKQLDNARKTLKDLQTRFPRTTAARLAEKRLERIRIESN
ncbi:MAG: tol-pal system protein YbgF [Gammaproteobacteria bacterium]|nr:MAG: tol-pal system protein YbgF [Gammaproteobacteria bacterium]